MAGLVVLLITFVIGFYITSWTLRKVICWLFIRKYNICLKIGKIGLPYLKLCDIQVSKNGFNIHIEEISIKSSFLNSELTKLVTLVVRDVRINKDIGQNGFINKSNGNFIDFRHKEVPHFINTFAQFMAVHIYNVSAMLLRSETPECLTHAIVSELRFDGSILKSAKLLLVTLNLIDASMKILQHAENQSKETCLAEFKFGISMDLVLVAQGPLSVEKLDIRMSQTSAIINDSFYNMAQARNVRKNRTTCNDSNGDVLQRIKPLIPKNCLLHIEDTCLRGVKGNGQIEYNSSLKKFLLNYRTIVTTAEDTHVLVNFIMSELHLQNTREKLIVLKALSIDAKRINQIVDIYFQLNNFSIFYNHDLIHDWVYNNFLKNPLQPPTIKKNAMRLKQQNRQHHQLEAEENLNLVNGKNNLFLEQLFNDLMINICAEFLQVSSSIKLNGRSSSIGFNHMKLMLEQAHEIRDSVYNSYLLNLILRDRYWQMEFLIESFWWSFKEWNQDMNISKNMHIWGTPIYFVKVLCKLWSIENDQVKIVSLLDTIQLEWSLELADWVLLAIKCAKQYNLNYPNNTKKLVQPNKTTGIQFSSVINHFNCFFQSQNTEYFVAQLNSIKIEEDQYISTVQFREFKVFTTNNTGAYYCCIRSEDISNYKIFLKQAQISLNKEKTMERTLKLFEEVIVNWSTNVHLKLLLLIKDIKEFFYELIDEFNFKQPTSTITSSNKNSVITYNCFVTGKFLFNVQISDNYLATLSIDTLKLMKSPSSINIENICTVISIDGAEIFTIKGLNVIEINENQLIREERMDNENFQLNWNKTWGITIDLFKALFPYEHNYADAIQNELVSVFKWLKIVHDYKKPEFTQNSPLPCDLLINIKEFLFEMSDDQFEVKLRDNFELLVDEHHESLKRQKMLKEKIAELCKTHLHLPAGKVEELYANLKKKDAEIYVLRSKQMLKAVPARTRLFAWSMTNVEIMVLVDPSIHGTENVVHIMKEIDADSPWPEEKIEFSTLWCRVVSLRCKEWKFQLRDFPQPLLLILECYICGQLVGAEQQSPKRAKRTTVVNLGEPFEPFIIERGMLPLKFYHDFNCEIQSYSYAFGPCWEPVIAQCNLSFEKIFAPSRDPSPPLSFWDKMRLLLHGRLTMLVQQLTVLLHASLDPYNTTEEMELTWNQVLMDWTNAKFVYKGDLNIFVRTASKYDDCRLLHLPNLKLVLGMDWVCLGNPNDHHNVIQCAPDKIPEYSSNQVHDSFRAFRSQNVNLSILLETKPVGGNQNTISAATPAAPTNFDYPTLLLYGSTLRWIENLKLILSGVTRPTKRGKIFNNVRARKIQLSRHYKKIQLLMGLHKFQVCYWMSFAMQRGCELTGGRLSCCSEHELSLVSIDDGLKHRPKAEWSIIYMNSELNDSEIWLKSALQEDSEIEIMSFRQPVEKCYCLSVAKVSYGREAAALNCDRNKDTPIHRLVVYDLRGAWTKSNRNVAFALFDTFMKNKQMKKNLSTEALKGFRKDSNTTPLKRRNTEAPGTPPNSTIQAIQVTPSQDTPSPITKLQSGHAANMLQQLIAEADNKAVVYSDDLSSVTREQHLQGLHACQEDDVQHKNWQIALVNAQVLLKGCETKGYVILSAAKAEIVKRTHRPVWKDRTLVSKTTWTGILECMQYYATVNAGDNDSVNENIMWLTVDNIQEKESTEISEPSEVPNMVGSGVSVGAVVSDTVGPSSSRQLQRIVSRCKCEFFYAGYGDISVDPEAIGEVPPPPQEEVSPWDRRQNAIDAFTLMHYDLDVCTNSLQYAMLLDVVNNLLLYVEPHRKEALERLARMRFQLQLHTVEDQRRPIQNQQTLVRTTVSKLRHLEKETYLVGKALAENPDDLELIQEMDRLEKLVYECKNQLNAQSEELDMMLSCYKETQLLVNSRLATTRNDKPLTIVRANEICFKHAQWRLTEADGQIGIADLVLSNFLYTKNSKSDDSVEHLLELGYLRMTNLLPNEIYKEVLCPSEIQHGMPIEYKKVLRVFCREKQPVGGISVKEHFEINLVPLTIGLTKKFYGTMMKFCFPERDTDNDYSDRISEDGEVEAKFKKSKSARRTRDSNFYIHIDDVEKMKERAEKNKLFVYIKIPEVPVRVSYKGTKEKNLEDLRDVSLIIPTLEYHNMTWTWLDLLMAIRNDSKRVILSQAIKQKLQIKRNTGSLDESSSPQEEDKARMLFGSRHATENRSMRKGVGGVFKFGK